MAHAATNQIANTGFGFGGIIGALKSGLQRRALYRQTLTELNALSNRELSDLGLSRSGIRNVAREAAYGK